MRDTPEPVQRSSPGAEVPSGAAPPAAWAGPGATRLGDYVLEAEIGRGGMGIVCRARHATTGRVVAVKVLSPRLAEDPRFVERFHREAEAMGVLQHPRIVRVLDRGVHEGVPFFAMELAAGGNMRQRMKAQCLSVEEVVRLAMGICRGLEFAHGHGIVHRDLKPENILLTESGAPLIADFGLARVFGDDWVEASRRSLTGAAVGTPYYMAPEQIKGATHVDGRADLFSLGVVLHEALTGELPIGRIKPLREWGRRLDPRLDDILLRLLEPVREKRFASADDAAFALRTVLEVPYSEKELASDRPGEDTRLLRDRTRNWMSIRQRCGPVLVGMGFLCWLVGAGLTAGNRKNEFAMWAPYVLGVALIALAQLVKPRYTGAQCPICKRFRVRQTTTWVGEYREYFRCDDCCAEFAHLPQ